MAAVGASPTADDALFLKEIAAYLDTQELLPVALWGLLPPCDDAPLYDLQDESEQSQGSYPAQGAASLEPAAYQNPPPPPVKATTAKARNLSRERMQNELRQLRAQSEELERQLAALQEGTRSHAPSQQESLRLLASRERVAKHQLELRAASEAENARLKAQLESQFVTVRNLQALLRQHAEGGHYHQVRPAFFPTRSYDTLATPGGFANSGDVAIYKQLLAELDDTWLRMDSVFQENGLSTLRITSSIPSQARMKTRRSSHGSKKAGSLYIELIEAEVLPFERDFVFSVSWECWARREAAKKAKDQYIVFEQKPMEMIASITRVCINFKGSEVPLDLIHVARIYRDEERICYVWRGITKADSHFPGVLIDETGWQVMKSTAGSSSPSIKGTEILTCWQLESKSCSGESASSRVSPLANLVISTTEAETMEVNSRMLKMLLQET